LVFRSLAFSRTGPLAAGPGSRARRTGPSHRIASEDATASRALRIPHRLLAEALPLAPTRRTAGVQGDRRTDGGPDLKPGDFDTTTTLSSLRSFSCLRESRRSCGKPCLRRRGHPHLLPDCLPLWRGAMDGSRSSAPAITLLTAGSMPPRRATPDGAALTALLTAGLDVQADSRRSISEIRTIQSPVPDTLAAGAGVFHLRPAAGNTDRFLDRLNKSSLNPARSISSRAPTSPADGRRAE